MVGTSHRGMIFVPAAIKMTSSSSRVTLDRRGAMLSIVPPGNVLQHASMSLSCTRWPRPRTNDDPTIDTLTRRRRCPRVFFALVSSMGSGDWLRCEAVHGYCRWHTRLLALIVNNIDVIRCMILKDGKTFAAWYSHNVLCWVGITVGWIGSRFNSLLATNICSFSSFTVWRISSMHCLLLVTSSNMGRKWLSSFTWASSACTRFSSLT